jgi:hypothetical protein
VIYTGDKATHEALKHHEQLIKGSTRAQAILYEASARDASALEENGEIWNAHVVLASE